MLNRTRHRAASRLGQPGEVLGSQMAQGIGRVMVSFALVTCVLGSDRAHILPGGDEYAGAVTALSGTHFTAYVPSGPVPSVRVGHQEVDTSVLNGFPDSEQFRSRALFAGHQVTALSWLPEKRVFSSFLQFFVPCARRSPPTPSSQLPLMLRWALLWTSPLGVGEPIVNWHVWISSVKLPEFLQTA